MGTNERQRERERRRNKRKRDRQVEKGNKVKKLEKWSWLLISTKCHSELVLQ